MQKLVKIQKCMSLKHGHTVGYYFFISSVFKWNSFLEHFISSASKNFTWSWFYTAHTLTHTPLRDKPPAEIRAMFATFEISELPWKTVYLLPRLSFPPFACAPPLKRESDGGHSDTRGKGEGQEQKKKKKEKKRERKPEKARTAGTILAGRSMMKL